MLFRSRINGANRQTTFIDNSHLLIQVTGNDMYLYRTNGGFYITVFNPAPVGGYSNSIFFTINNTVSSSTSTSAKNTSSNFTDTTTTGTDDTNNINSNSNDLGANAIFGFSNLIPSSLIQWVFFAILILLIVILVRRISGGKEKYDAVPLKHS